MRVKFGTGTHQAKEIINYIHSNLWEPSRTPTHANATCFFIDH